MAANGGNTGGGGGERARGYAKETFEKWAHPFADAISTNDFVRDYHYFIPITAFRRGAIGFRDLTQAPSMMKSATGYCTVLQFLGELMRFLPTKGTVTQEHSATYTFKRGNGELVTLPKVRFLVQCVVRDTHKLGLALDLLPEHELLNPHNHLGIMISLLFHDPNLELIDLIEALVSESASKQPQERRAYLMDEIRNAELLDEQQRQESDGEASDGEEGDDAGPGRASDKTEAAAAADGGAAAARGKRPRAKGKGARGEKKRPRRGARQSIMQPQRKDPIEDYITYKKIDQLKSAIILLLDVATGNSEVSNKLRYITRAQLIDAIRNRTDPIVNLEYKLGFDATLSRIREFATKVRNFAKLAKFS